MAQRAGTALVRVGWPLEITVTAADTGARVRMTCTVERITEVAADYAMALEVGGARFTPLPAAE